RGALTSDMSSFRGAAKLASRNDVMMPLTDDKQVHRKGAFFGRRKGHALKPRQAALFETLLPRLALDLSAPARELPSPLPQPVDDVRLEIGFGGGEHLISEATQHPRTGFI